MFPTLGRQVEDNDTSGVEPSCACYVIEVNASSKIIVVLPRLGWILSFVLLARVANTVSPHIARLLTLYTFAQCEFFLPILLFAIEWTYLTLLLFRKRVLDLHRIASFGFETLVAH